MLEIEFNLEQPQTSWNAKIHQLNSDVLRRHVLPKLHSNCYKINFNYCEKTQFGTILCDSGSKLGSFTVN